MFPKLYGYWPGRDKVSFFPDFVNVWLISVPSRTLFPTPSVLKRTDNDYIYYSQVFIVCISSIFLLVNVAIHTVDRYKIKIDKF